MSSPLLNMPEKALLPALGQAFLKTKKRRYIIIDLERKDLRLYNVSKPNS